MRASLKPLVRSISLRDQVYERMRESIRAGRIRPGDRLQEISLAEALGVSRTPVREALALLAKDGLARLDGRGFVVTALTPKDIDDIFELRRLLEPAAIRDATKAMDVEGAAVLRAALKKSRKAHAAGVVDAFIAANAEFRAAWLALVPNPRLVRAVGLYDDHTDSLRTMTLGTARVRAIVLAGIAAIVEAMAAGDAAKAAAAMLAHLGEAEAALRAAAMRQEQEKVA
jgi:DNA-binding GntR family transcriptional regulator